VAFSVLMAGLMLVYSSKAQENYSYKVSKLNTYESLNLNACSNSSLVPPDRFINELTQALNYQQLITYGSWLILMAVGFFLFV
jgi:hypothetical protein